MADATVVRERPIPPSAPQRKRRSDVLFQLEGVTKRYGAVVALDQLSITVPWGAIGLLGPNGSGKTTMIRALLGLIRIDRGSGQVLGHDIRRRQLDIRRLVGFVPEDECLFPHVVGVDFVAYAGELVGMPRKDALQRAHEVLDYVGLGEARYRRVESYSTGMKQRLKLASAIIHDPELLILDEPTNGMDPAGREDILELARDLSRNKGMSLLFSSHLLPDVEAVCHEVIVLGSGKLLTQGNIQQLKQLHNRYFEVRVKADAETLIERLSAMGCTTEIRDDSLLVQIPEGRSPQIIWEIAAAHRLQIRNLRPQRSTLEEVFLKALGARLMPIFDQGYQHWNGHLSGHAWRWLAITRHGVRIGMQRRMLRTLLLISLLPAVVLAGAMSIWSLIERQSQLVEPIVQFLMMSGIVSRQAIADPRHYRVEIWTLCYNLFLTVELTFSMLLVVLVGPDLISQDLRFNALPLYLSRPLRRIDYFFGKLGVIAAFLGLMIVVPCVVAYGLGLLLSLDLTILKDTYRVLLASVGFGLVVIVSTGTLILALSSLSRNSRYIVLFWLGIWIISNVVATVLERTHDVQLRQTRVDQSFEPMPPPMRRRPGQRGRVRPPSIAQAERDGYIFDKGLEASQSDWRPLVSYTANLSRIGRELLGTDAAWRTLGELEPPSERGRFLFGRLGPQYPWYWSAGVLAGLFGISACILSRSVRSLDRLK